MHKILGAWAVSSSFGERMFDAINANELTLWQEDALLVGFAKISYPRPERLSDFHSGAYARAGPT